MAQIQIEQEYLTSRYTSYQYLNIWSNNLNLNPSSFSILEAQPMDMLLGLDMLKKHQVGSLLPQPGHFIYIEPNLPVHN